MNKEMSEEIEGASRNPQKEQALRALGSVSLVAIFTVGAIYFNRHGFYPPHGNPLIYAIAMSWFIAIFILLPSIAFFKATPRLFSLARWEKEGRIYDRSSVRAFRWCCFIRR
jgi:hypothetical protein